MYDLVIQNARICDGTGQPSFMGTLGVQDGLITYIGQEAGLAAQRTLDAAGLALAPGFIDPHTHYDAQIVWDQMLTSSPWHGVTTVVMGNCGVGMAPVKAEMRDILMQDLVNVEAIPYEVMKAGIDWQWESYREYLDAIGRVGLGLNVAGLVAFTPLRHYVLGEESLSARPPRTKLPPCVVCCARRWRPGPSGLRRRFLKRTSVTGADRWPAAMPARPNWQGCVMLCGT